MKLHDLAPAEGAHRSKTRVGRGIAAGKGKTAGRGTKGQKARAGGSIPPWFEGGQTPLHMRIPKLRGFRNRAKVVYEVGNVGDIAARIEAGAFAASGTTPKKSEPMTVNADILRAVGLVRDVKKPLKILGNGELSAALFVVADAFTKSAAEKIQAAGGSVNVLEVPAESRPALGVDGAAPAAEASSTPAPAAPKAPKTTNAGADASAEEPTAKPARAARTPNSAKASASEEPAGTTDAAAPIEATADAADPLDEALTADEAASDDATEAGESIEAVTADSDAGPADGADATDASDDSETDTSTDESA